MHHRAEGTAGDVTVIQSMRSGDLDEVVRQVARLQADPEYHVGYLSLDAESVAEELTGLPGGPTAAVVAIGGGRPVGLLAADYDRDPPRVWWHGPFVWSGDGWRAVADRLYASARRRLPRHVAQEELNPDDRSYALADFAHAHDFHPETAAAVLVLQSPLEGPPPEEVVPATAADRVRLTKLHEDLFPDARSAGAPVIDAPDPQRVVLVTRRAGGLAGYVAVEYHAGEQGYLDFVGVRPDLRRRGLGRALVTAGVHWLQEQGCETVSLTIGEDLRAARALYESVGFVEERLVRPWRKGVSVQPLETTTDVRPAIRLQGGARGRSPRSRQPQAVRRSPRG